MQLPETVDLWIVDDDPSALAALEEAAARAGWKTYAFSSTAAAIETLATRTPGCVVADLWVGDHDGLALIERVRQTAWPAPSILISGHLVPSVTLRAVRAGVSTVLEKPFDMRELMREVASAMVKAERAIEYLKHKFAAQRSFATLPEGHRAVLSELMACRPHKQIASRLDIAIRTVDKRKREIFDHLGVSNFVELLAKLRIANETDFALEGGILPTVHAAHGISKPFSAIQRLCPSTSGESKALSFSLPASNLAAAFSAN